VGRVFVTNAGADAFAVRVCVGDDGDTPFLTAEQVFGTDDSVIIAWRD